MCVSVWFCSFGTLSLTFLSVQFHHFFFKTFNESFNSQRTEADILSIVSKAEEFEQLKVSGRPE